MATVAPAPTAADRILAPVRFFGGFDPCSGPWSSVLGGGFKKYFFSFWSRLYMEKK
jgi:hypothetical protein